MSRKKKKIDTTEKFLHVNAFVASEEFGQVTAKVFHRRVLRNSGRESGTFKLGRHSKISILN